MASSLNSANFNGWNGSHFSLILEYDISQSVAENYSDITYYLKMQSSDGYSGGGATAVGKINDNQVGTFSYIGANTTIDIGQRTERIYHNDDGTKSVSYSAFIDTSWDIGDASVSGTLTLPKIDRFAIMTGATSNPTDESDIYFTYSNPRNLDLYAWLEVNPVSTHIAVRNLTNVGTNGTYTWELTTEERNQLRASLPNTNSGTLRIGIRSTIGSSTQASYRDRKFTIVNANPTFLNYDIEDVNLTTVALTGSTENNVININGYSNIKATITTSNKAEAIKEATMSKYRFTIDDSSTDIGYSDDSNVSGTLNGSTSGIYNLYAIDSRNNSTLVTKQATKVINYKKIAIDKQNCSFVRDSNQVGENAILTINGTFWNDNDGFGQVNNSITSVSYKLKKSGSSTWITGTTTITPQVHDNTFTYTGQIASDNLDTTWDLDSSYNLQVIINDKLSNDSVDLILNSAVPTMSLDKNGVGILCAYDSYKGGLLQVGGNIVDGGKVLWVNDNPSNITTDTQISLSSSDYDYILWVVRVSLRNSLIVFQYSLDNYGTRVYLGANFRDITRNSDTSYTISTYSDTNNPQNCIPIYAIGYKTNLFN